MVEAALIWETRLVTRFILAIVKPIGVSETWRCNAQVHGDHGELCGGGVGDH